MSKIEVEFYQTKSGLMPAAEFVKSLEVKLRAKTLRTIELLANNGNELCEPYSKRLKDGIFELRTKAGSDITRVLYFFYVGKNSAYKWLCKKTQKTPEAEIELAKK